MFYFTADTHFGHNEIIKLCDRPFESAEEMDESMVKNWNERVQESDTVVIVGDFIHKSTHSPEYYLERLKGRKRLVIGNHDHKWMPRCDLSKYFDNVGNYEEIEDSTIKNRIIISHYPMMSWNRQNKGSYMVHGHIHNTTDAPFFPLLCSLERLLNAGVEINDYMPVSFEELIRNNREFKEANGWVSV
ncbi:MAG: metallophosphoesterase [Deltaproteobacteria bacterium]|jgi:calcineurin-like phosphoesterase family protein|nr:metallophosphoesterase [Deltaproteobacteria bacterium]